MTNTSVATDLGALLRESLNDEAELADRQSASMPVRIATPPGFGVQSLPKGAPIFIDETLEGTLRMLSPVSSMQPVGVPTPPPSSTAAIAMTPRSVVPVLQPMTAEKPSSSSFGRTFAALAAVGVLLAAGGGFGAAYWKAHKAHAAPVAAAVVAPPPAAANAEAPPPEVVAALLDTPPPVAKNAPAAEVKAAEEPPAVAAAPPKAKQATLARTTEAPAAKPVIEKAPVPVKAVAAQPTPAPAKVAAERPSAPKPATAAAPGAVDALIQQQLNGAIP